MNNTLRYRNRFFIIGFLVTISLLLSSCSTFTIHDANKFRKGMTPFEVEDISSTRPAEDFNFTISSASSDKYSAQVYKIVFGEVKSIYLVVFKDDKLVYWGFPYEFARHPDALINEIGQAAFTKYNSL